METRSLSDKQRWQFVNRSAATLSHIHSEEVPLVKLIEKAHEYCIKTRLGEDYMYKKSFAEKLILFNAKYFPFGVKPNEGNLDLYMYRKVKRLASPRFTPHAFSTYKPVEKIAFVMCQRACYKYLTKKIDTETFIEKLEQIRLIIF